MRVLELKEKLQRWNNVTEIILNMIDIIGCRPLDFQRELLINHSLRYPLSVVSMHLRILRDLGLVYSVREGKRRRYFRNERNCIDLDRSIREMLLLVNSEIA